MNVDENLAALRERIIGAGGDPQRIRIVAVTKKFGPEAVRAVVRAGLSDIGENYAQEARDKHDQIAEAAPRLCWHFVGQLQRNKVRMLAPFVNLWHTIDDIGIADEVAKRQPGARVLVQVNLTDDPNRGGCTWGEVDQLVDRVRSSGLDAAGLMAIGPPGNPEEARSGYRHLAATAARLQLEELSMGMTDDLEVAVQEGATIVRVGSALLGIRPRS